MRRRGNVFLIEREHVKHKRRRKNDRYDDLRMLPPDTTEPVVFFGGKDYVGLFCALTEHVQGQRYLFYNSSNVSTPVGN